jgi:serine/threonine-protein kinase HipA
MYNLAAQVMAELKWRTTLMATACIEMMESRLMEENGRAHFMKSVLIVKAELKAPCSNFRAMQHYDFSQITSFSYEQLFQTMRLLKLSTSRNN